MIRCARSWRPANWRRSALTSRASPRSAGAAGDLDQAFRREGLLHEVVGAGVHRLYRHGDVAVTGDQHHRQARVEGLETLQQGQAIDAGQADVADDDAGEVAVDPLQRLLGAADADAGDVLQLQRLPGSRARHADRLRRSGRKAARSSGGTRSRGIGNQGQAQLEGGSAAFGVLHAEAAAGGGGQAGREGQAEAQPCSPGLVVKKGSNRWTRAAGGYRGRCRARAGRSAPPRAGLPARAGGRPARSWRRGRWPAG